MKRCILILNILLLALQANAQCTLKTEKDAFTGIIKSRSTGYELVGVIGRTGDLRFKITETYEKDTTLTLYIKVHRLTIRCFGKDSELLIKSGEEVVTLKLLGENYCGTDIEDYTKLSSEVIIYLTTHNVTAISIKYTRGIDDFLLANAKEGSWIVDKGGIPNYFLRTLRCFE